MAYCSCQNAQQGRLGKLPTVCVCSPRVFVYDCNSKLETGFSSLDEPCELQHFHRFCFINIDVLTVRYVFTGQQGAVGVLASTEVSFGSNFFSQNKNDTIQPLSATSNLMLYQYGCANASYSCFIANQGTGLIPV